MPSVNLLLIVGLPLLGALIIGFKGHQLSARVVVATALLPQLAALALAVMSTVRVVSSASVEVAVLGTWLDVGPLQFEFALWLDPLAGLMCSLVTCTAILIGMSSISTTTDPSDRARFFAALNLLVSCLLLLVTGKNLLVTCVGWQGAAISSSFLLGNSSTGWTPTAAHVRALRTRRVGDIALLVGLLLTCFYAKGSLDFVQLDQLFAGGGSLDPDVPRLSEAAQSARITVVSTLGVLFLIAVAAHTSQVPFQFWLLETNGTPNGAFRRVFPIATAIGGLYLLFRLTGLYAHSEFALFGVACIGGLTALVATTSATVKRDVYGVLTHVSIAQIGIILVAYGCGGFKTALYHLAAFLVLMPVLFLTATALIEERGGESDMWRLRSTGSKQRTGGHTFLIGTLALGGAPLLAGFVTGTQMMSHAFQGSHNGSSPNLIFGLVLTVTTFGTAFCLFRLYWLLFQDSKSREPDRKQRRRQLLPVHVLAIIALCMSAAYALSLGGVKDVLWDSLGPLFAAAESHFIYPSDKALSWPIMAGLACLVSSAAFFSFRSVRKYEGDAPCWPRSTWWVRFFQRAWYIDAMSRTILGGPGKMTARFFRRLMPLKKPGEEVGND